MQAGKTKNTCPIRDRYFLPVLSQSGYPGRLCTGCPVGIGERRMLHALRVVSTVCTQRDHRRYVIAADGL